MIDFPDFLQNYVTWKVVAYYSKGLHWWTIIAFKVCISSIYVSTTSQYSHGPEMISVSVSSETCWFGHMPVFPRITFTATLYRYGEALPWCSLCPLDHWKQHSRDTSLLGCAFDLWASISCAQGWWETWSLRFDHWFFRWFVSRKTHAQSG